MISLHIRMEVVMLVHYFLKPVTVDRFRGFVDRRGEAYVAWLVEQGYGTKSIWRRVPIVFAIGELARAQPNRERVARPLAAYVQLVEAAR
jgi:hypothetical protein